MIDSHCCVKNVSDLNSSGKLPIVSAATAALKFDRFVNLGLVVVLLSVVTVCPFFLTSLLYCFAGMDIWCELRTKTIIHFDYANAIGCMYVTYCICSLIVRVGSMCTLMFISNDACAFSMYPGDGDKWNLFLSPQDYAMIQRRREECTFPSCSFFFLAYWTTILLLFK